MSAREISRWRTETIPLSNERALSRTRVGKVPTRLGKYGDYESLPQLLCSRNLPESQSSTWYRLVRSLRQRSFDPGQYLLGNTAPRHSARQKPPSWALGVAFTRLRPRDW